MIRSGIVLATVFLSCVLLMQTGCGYKDDLYLPPPAKPDAVKKGPITPQPKTNN